MNQADEPLKKATVNLYEEDLEFLRKRYGWGWSEHIRTWIRDRITLIKDRENGNN